MRPRRKDQINFNEFNDPFDHSFLQTIKVLLELDGFVTIQNFPTKENEIEILCSHLGTTDYIEDNLDYDFDLGYHTDGYHLVKQSDFYALYYIEQAAFIKHYVNYQCINTIIDLLCLRNEDVNTLNLLSKSTYPFFACSVSSSLSDKEAPILKENIINKKGFRFCTFAIFKALEANPKLCTESQLEAIKELSRIIDSTLGEHVEILPNSIIIVNNKKVLHKINPNLYNQYLRKIRIFK